jgi:hypothetical protein
MKAPLDLRGKGRKANAVETQQGIQVSENYLITVSIGYLIDLSLEVPP